MRVIASVTFVALLAATTVALLIMCRYRSPRIDRIAAAIMVRWQVAPTAPTSLINYLVATIGKLLAIILLAGALAAPAFAFDTRPNPNLTGGSVRVDGHDVQATCGHAKAHRGSMSHARRDEILTRYGLPPGDHPDYEIDHLIPLCLGGSDDPSNLWPEPRRTIEPKWNAGQGPIGAIYGPPLT